MPFTQPEPTPPASPGEALFRFQYRDRPHIWHQWAMTDDAFRAHFELEAAKIAAVAAPAAPRIILSGDA